MAWQARLSHFWQHAVGVKGPYPRLGFQEWKVLPRYFDTLGASAPQVPGFT